VDGVIAAISRDKKRVGSRVPFVLVSVPGDVRYGCEVDPEDVRAAVQELCS
jgi:3-dehydroquinate synthetase